MSRVPGGPYLRPGLASWSGNLGGRFFTAKSIVRMPATFEISWALTGVKVPPVETKDGVFRVLTFSDLPAQTEETFRLDAVEGFPPASRFTTSCSNTPNEATTNTGTGAWATGSRTGT